MSKVGDRYQSTKNGLIHEIIAIRGNTCRFKCIDIGNTSNWYVGETPRGYTNDNWVGWICIGNYSKENNFNQLYNLFNDDN